MCGIFAFAGPRLPDPALLRLASEQAARRGPHAHGWVTHDKAGADASHHALGPIGDCHSCDTVQPSGPRVLGHSRLATFGQPDDLAGTQPLVTGRIARRYDDAGPDSPVHALAHNGNVYNADHLAPGMPSDSAALLAVYAQLRSNGDTPSEALSLTIQAADQAAWAVVVLDVTGEMVAHRHGLPLYRHTDPTGVYLSSVAFAGAVEVPADTLLREAPPL